MSLDPILQLSVALHLSICVPSIILSIKCYAITKHTLNFRVELSLGDQIETWGNRIVIRFIGNARFSSPFHHCFIMRFDSLADSRGPQWIHLLSTNSLLISVEFCFQKTDICVSECVVLEYHVRQESESRRYNHFKQRHTSFWWEKGIISPHYFLMILSDQSTVNSQCSVKSDRCAVLRALPKRLGR